MMEINKIFHWFTPLSPLRDKEHQKYRATEYQFSGWNWPGILLLEFLRRPVCVLYVLYIIPPKWCKCHPVKFKVPFIAAVVSAHKWLLRSKVLGSLLSRQSTGFNMKCWHNFGNYNKFVSPTRVSLSLLT